jgi:hypothetical protein
MYLYLSHFDELSFQDKSSGDKMYSLHFSDDGTIAASGEQ